MTEDPEVISCHRFIRHWWETLANQSWYVHMRRFIIRHNQRRVCVGQKVGHFVVAVGERGGLETFESLMKSIRG